MRFRTSILTWVLAMLVSLANPYQLVAKGHRHYKLIDLGTFGGPNSYLNIPNGYATVLNNYGTVAGWADTSMPDPYPSFCFNEDCFISHAFRSRNGLTKDLGVLPGGASSATNWISENGLIAGFSENGDIDPLFAGFPEIRAVLWKNRRIVDLGVLPEGGYESMANAVNNLGQVVGFATNTTPDDFSLFGTTQARAFLWQDGVMRDLGTLGGSDAMALLINDRGQIVGESYTDSVPSAYCAANLGFSLTTGAFIWKNGKMKDLGSFGGSCTFATDLNNRGQIVGISTLAGDQIQHAFLWTNRSLRELPNAIGGNNTAAIALNDDGDAVGWAAMPGDQQVHASLWKRHRMTDVGTLSSDPCSIAVSVNAREQVVGFSSPCDFSQSRAFLWEDGSITDLNTLIPASSPLYLTSPETINDRGEIAGIGLDSAGNEHAFLLIPCSAQDAAGQDAIATTSAASISAPLSQHSPATNPTNFTRRVPGRHLRLPQL